jgi:hypothetical protein
VQDLAVECNFAESALFSYGVGIPFLLLYAFGIPVMSFVVLYHRRHKLHSDPRTRATYGFLYSGFKPRWYGFESIIMLRKSMLAFMSVALAPFGVYTQSICAVLILVGSSVMHARARPYSRQVLNRLEGFSLATTLLTLLGGLYLFAETISHNVQIGVSFFLVGINGLYLLYNIYYFVRVLKSDYQVAYAHASVRLKDLEKLGVFDDEDEDEDEELDDGDDEEGKQQTRTKVRFGAASQENPLSSSSGSAKSAMPYSEGSVGAEGYEEKSARFSSSEGSAASPGVGSSAVQIRVKENSSVHPAPADASPVPALPIGTASDLQEEDLTGDNQLDRHK